MNLNTAASRERQRLWIDADPSGLVWTGLDCDDDLALLVALALNASGEVQLEGISVSGGNAPLAHTAADARLLLDFAGPPGAGVGVAAGVGWRSMQVAVPPLRWLHHLNPDVSDSEEAARAIIAAAAVAPPRSLTVLVLGPPTNLARALALSPGLGRRLRRAVLMGGELTGRRLDLNFMTDRGAARAVIEEPALPTVIVPVQTCAQACVARPRVERFAGACCPGAAACALLPKMRLQTFLMPLLVNRRVRAGLPDGGPWPASTGLDAGFIPWDVVAILALARPELFEAWDWHSVELPACPAGEPCDGTMAAVRRRPPPLSADGAAPESWSGLALVPQRLRSEEEVLDATFQLLCEVPAGGQHPRLLWGFLGPLLAATAAASLLLAAVVWALARLVAAHRRRGRRRGGKAD